MSEFMQLLLRVYVCAVKSCNTKKRKGRFTANLLKLIGEDFAIWFRVASKDLSEPYCLHHTRNGRHCFTPGIVKAAVIFFNNDIHNLFKAEQLIRMLKTPLSYDDPNHQYHNLTPLSIHFIGKEKMKPVVTWWWDDLEKRYLPFEEMMRIEIGLRRKLDTNEHTGRFLTAIEKIAGGIYLKKEKKGRTVKLGDFFNKNEMNQLIKVVA